MQRSWYSAFLLSGIAGCCAAAPTNASGLRLQDDTITIAKDATGKIEGSVGICNQTKAAIPLDLKLDHFTGPGNLRRDATLPSPPRDALAAGACAAVKVAVADAGQVWGAAATLRNRGVPIGTVRLLRTGTPFGLAVDGMPADKPEVHLFRNNPEGKVRLFGREELAFRTNRLQQDRSRIIIKNSDPWAYDLRVEVDAESHSCRMLPSTATVTILANQSIPIYLTCEDGPFAWFATGFLKPETRPAQAVVYVREPGGNADLPIKRAPITTVWSYYPEWFERYANAFWSLAVLVAGALLSVLATIVAPNWSRRSELRNRLAPLGQSLAGEGDLLGDAAVSPNADHERARLLLRLEWRCLKDILDSTFPLSMNAGVALDSVQAKTELLERKVALFRRVDAALLATVDLEAGRLPPSVLERVNLHCATGITLLLRPSLTSDEWTTLADLVSKSEDLLGDIRARLDWLETEVKAVETEVKAILCDPSGALRTTLSPPWSSLCHDLLEAVPRMVDVPFFPSQYAARDRRAVLFTYVRRYEAIGSLPASPINAEAKERATRGFETACKKRPFDLATARRRIEELESGVFLEELIQEIRNRRVRIVPADSVVAAYSPMRYHVLFSNRPGCNTAAVKQEIGVRWDFGDGAEKPTDGWEVWRYFSKKAALEVTVQFFVKSGGSRQPIEADGQPVTIHTTVKVERDPPHLTNVAKKIDLLRFALAVATATFAVSGVRQLLPTTDAFSALIGALALGFGADTFKNLITAKK